MGWRDRIEPIENHVSGNSWRDRIQVESGHEEPSFLSQLGDSALEQLPALGAMAGGIAGTATPFGPVVGAGVGGYLGSAAKNAYNYFNSPAQAPQSWSE